MRAVDLLSLIHDDTGHREKECQPALLLIKQFLCREIPRNILQVGREEPNRYGSNDFCVSAVVSDGSTDKRCAYVWEVKSPQSHILEFDDHSLRLRPTMELVKAETQLFHYVEEFKSSRSFRHYFDLNDLAEVIPAGIIIGSEKTLVKKGRLGQGKSLDELKRLYQISMHARHQYLYKAANILVKDWSWVYGNLLSLENPSPIVPIGSIAS
ncbi:hypothetical protein [Roseomonas indoligenes]|uniref:Uncharacterized protein n=1 Tax=Roseomonas indoligenes TaxID=2820811 RepID=A0A940MXK1_9PROT|nr:hypothetical protein [Pararoseomonas indoligenes]MBP0492840.1 hypothetical protein [Pararoseomonas indoligenes]